MPLTPDNLYLEWWPIREINQSQRNPIGKLHAVKMRRSHFSMELVYGFTALAILLAFFPLIRFLANWLDKRHFAKLAPRGRLATAASSEKRPKLPRNPQTSSSSAPGPLPQGFFGRAQPVRHLPQPQEALPSLASRRTHHPRALHRTRNLVPRKGHRVPAPSGSGARRASPIMARRVADYARRRRMAARHQWRKARRRQGSAALSRVGVLRRSARRLVGRARPAHRLAAVLHHSQQLLRIYRREKRVLHIAELGEEHEPPFDTGRLHDRVYTGGSYRWLPPEDLPDRWRRWPIDIVAMSNELTRHENKHRTYFTASPDNPSDKIYADVCPTVREQQETDVELHPLTFGHARISVQALANELREPGDLSIHPKARELLLKPRGLARMLDDQKGSRASSTTIRKTASSE